MKGKCIFCEGKISHELLKEYSYWKVYLNSNQCYLGRCEIVLKDHKADLFDCTEAELKELYEIVNRLKQITSQLFAPDLYNYSSLGNKVRHVHLHFVPRYSTLVSFAATEFKDERWGYNYAPYDKELEVSTVVLNKISKAIREKL